MVDEFPKAYDKFIPTAASAALLERFYGLGDRQGSEVKSLLDAVELYNDWTFRREADALKEKRDTTLKHDNSAYLREESQGGQQCQGDHAPRCIHGLVGGKGCYLCGPTHPYRLKQVGAT